tara:strand:- start:309 stop:917 length:609 start_codon:yes stop_codon:yes gene_type:complete
MKTQLKNFIGMFPLGIVVMPGEQTMLHIFEPRYKQLINDCFATNSDFGIPFYFNNKTQAYGTRVKLVDIDRFYRDGRMDIRIEGVSIFKINEYHHMFEEKLYPGGSIKEVKRNLEIPESSELVNLIRKYQILVLNGESTVEVDLSVRLFKIVNALNLSQEEKFKLIKTGNPDYQQNVLINHLRMVLNLYEQEKSLDHKFFLN